LPLAAQALISRTVAHDESSYEATKSVRGFTAANRIQELTARFTKRGVEVRSADLRLGLRLAAYGRGQALRPVAAVRPSARGNSVEYRRGQLVEWYANGPLGLEQGFTLISRPAGPRSRPLTLALDLAGNLSPSLTPDQHALRLGAGASLRYEGLMASDAVGRQLRAWLELDGRRVLVRVADAGARFPLTIDPLVQRAKLTASDGAALDGLGGSVAVSGDTVVASADSDVGANKDQGSVYVFVKPADGWANATETAKLTASDGAAFDHLGSSVAVSGDTVVVGDFRDDVGANKDQGSVYVFVKPSDGWANATETAKLTASDGAADDFLGSVAVSGDTVVAGAGGDDTGANTDQGSVYVFVKPSDGWANATETAKLTASDGAANDFLGSSVAVYGDTVVAGAYADNLGGGVGQGSVYVFVKPSDGWANATETAKLTASDGAAGDLLGNSVAVTGDTVVAGAVWDDAPAGYPTNAGSAYVFVKPADGWASGTETAKLTASDANGFDELGRSVAVSADTVVAGAAGDGANTHQGWVYVFVRPADGWASGTETAKLIALDGAKFDSLGSSVSVSATTIVAGAPGGGAVDQGAAYVFAPNQQPSCTGVNAAPNTIQPSTPGRMKLITLDGATDPDGDPLTFHIDAVTQDEPVFNPAMGDNTSPDAAPTDAGANSNQVLVRAERNAMGNGRVYRIAYTVSDGYGGSCLGTAGIGGTTNAKVSVPRKKGQTAVDDGDSTSWDSFTGAPVLGTLP
jgi:FG-GAP repeat